MAEIKPGFYKGRARANSAQYGLSNANQPQVGLDFDLFDEVSNRNVGVVTVPLSLAKGALPYSIERLRACGWEGKNILELDGVDRRDVRIQAFMSDFEGRKTMKFEIQTRAGGVFKFQREIPADKMNAFAAYVTRGIDAMPKDERGAEPGAEPQTQDEEVPF